MSLALQFRRLLDDGRLNLPFPGCGDTARRHWELAQIARENLELGRLAEAHTDALAILHEAGREARPNALYGVWASEGKARLQVCEGAVSGEKAFCTGAGIVDCALVTVMEPERGLLEIDLRVAPDRTSFDASGWVTDAFAETSTATTLFRDYPIREADLVGPREWYLERPGFWHGACGPASCWAGGAQGLVDYARNHVRADNSHAMAHLGAMEATEWQLRALLQTAGHEIDNDFENVQAGRVRALALRHLVEQSCGDTMLRFGRAFGPRPLAFEAGIAPTLSRINFVHPAIACGMRPGRPGAHVSGCSFPRHSRYVRRVLRQTNCKQMRHVLARPNRYFLAAGIFAGTQRQ